MLNFDWHSDVINIKILSHLMNLPLYFIDYSVVYQYRQCTWLFMIVIVCLIQSTKDEMSVSNSDENTLDFYIYILANIMLCYSDHGIYISLLCE